MHIHRSIAVLFFLLWITGSALAQASRSGDLKCKTVSGQQGEFTIRHLYVYSAKDNYQEQLPAKVTVKVKR